jgi:hypothetical protein
VGRLLTVEVIEFKLGSRLGGKTCVVMGGVVIDNETSSGSHRFIVLPTY